VRTSGDRLRGKFNGLGVFVLEEVHVNVHVGMFLTDLRVDSHSRENEDDQEEQRSFAAGEQRRARFAGSLRAEVVDQLGDAPQNYQHGPKAPEEVPDSQVWMETSEKKQDSENDEEQAAED
jgi:hypothetical protein